MRIGVLGTGSVGQVLGSAFVARGHQVVMGSRSRGNEVAMGWAEACGELADTGTFDEAARSADLLVNCTPGIHSLEVLASVAPESLEGAILLDVANPLDFSGGFPPRLSVHGDDSLAEQLQRAFPALRVVKALNTVNASVMVDPGSLPEETDLFVASDDPDAASLVTDLLVELGWNRARVRQLGGLAMARGTEMYLMLWLGLMGATGTAAFNIRVVTAEEPV